MEFTDILARMEIDPQETIRRFCQNEVLLKKYLIKFSEEETYSKLKEAVENKKYDDIEVCAHTLKGLSSNLGMNKLSKYCAKMVDAVRGNTYDHMDEMFSDVEKEYERLTKCLEDLKSL